MRYPAISPDGEDDRLHLQRRHLQVSSAGGTAAPVTTHTANDFMPVWSHDGKQIAFASDRYGNSDIYITSAEGGEAKRLTFHSSNVAVLVHGRRQGVIYSAARRTPLRTGSSHRRAPRAIGARRRLSPDSNSHNTRREREAEPRRRLPYI
jgi:tricorn protease-like protein